MKIRTGFVSNSSSSSFIVIMKNGKELNKETLLETFEVKETSPLYGFALDLTKWIIRNVKESNIEKLHDNFIGNYQKKNLTEEDMINELIDQANFDKEELEKVKSGEYRYYRGEASSDSDEAIETYLCYSGMDIENENIIIEGGEGY